MEDVRRFSAFESLGLCPGLERFYLLICLVVSFGCIPSLSLNRSQT